MLMGQMLTYAGMLENKEVSWLPSYGPEMRGGTANCNVIIADGLIGSPVITHDATTCVVMNLPSLDKFEADLVEGGTLMINSSLIEKKATRDDVKAYYVPANDIAVELGNARVANMVMLGAYLELKKTVDEETLIKALIAKLGEGKAHLVDINKEALRRGAECVK